MSKGWNPQGRSLELLLACQRLFEEYTESITLRQLFYLLQDEGYLRNDEASWRKLKTLTLKARKHGRMNPNVFSLDVHDTETTYVVDADEYVDKMVADYHIPRTYRQDNYIEIWVQREPLNVFIEHILGAFDIPVYVTGGYSNYSFTHSAAERLRDAVSREGSPRILYLSDFSASSHKMFETMVSDLAQALRLTEEEVSSIIFRVAINPEHIVKYGLPISYTPSREGHSDQFAALYADLLEMLELPDTVCVEIEALNPKVLSTLLHNVVFGLTSQETMMEVARLEAENLAKIKEIREQ